MLFIIGGYAFAPASYNDFLEWVGGVPCETPGNGFKLLVLVPGADALTNLHLVGDGLSGGYLFRIFLFLQVRLRFQFRFDVVLTAAEDSGKIDSEILFILLVEFGT